MQLSGKRNIRAFLALAKKNDYLIYDRPNELNIFGVRANKVIPNEFDDKLYVFYKQKKGNWKGHVYPITTDPGTYWLKNPMNVNGTSILKSGQYKNSYKLGLHKGQYEALVQSKPVTTIRDYDRNAILDFNNGKETKGMFGINIHKASDTGSTQYVDKWSAGCQVFKNANDFSEFIRLANIHKDLYGNSFTYTLVDERAYNRKLKRYGVYFIGGLLISLSIYAILKNYKK